MNEHRRGSHAPRAVGDVVSDGFRQVRDAAAGCINEAVVRQIDCDCTLKIICRESSDGQGGVGSREIGVIGQYIERVVGAVSDDGKFVVVHDR